MKIELCNHPVHGLCVVDAASGELVHGVRSIAFSHVAGKRPVLEVCLLSARVAEHFRMDGHSTTVRMVDPRSGDDRTVKSITWDNGDVWSPE